MTQTIRAVFENGVLRPLDPLHLQESEEVSVVVAVPDIVRKENANGTFPVVATAERARPITLETVQLADEDSP